MNISKPVGNSGNGAEKYGTTMNYAVVRPFGALRDEV
jgi:hypothetical protein